MGSESNGKDVHITVRVSNRLEREIEEWSDRRGYSRSEAVRKLFKQGLDYNDKIGDIEDRIDELETKVQNIDKRTRKLDSKGNVALDSSFPTESTDMSEGDSHDW